MKQFIHKENSASGELVLNTPIEAHVRIKGNPVLWTGTQDEFTAQWEPDASATPQVAQDEGVSKPYNYFVSFTSGGRIGNLSVRRSNPITSMEDIRELQAKINESSQLAEDVGILNFRVFDEPFSALEWASSAYPAIRRMLDEIRLVPNWAGYFEPKNREQLERLADYEPLGIPKENKTSPVANLVAGETKADPGATTEA